MRCMGRFKKERSAAPPPPVEGATWIPLTRGKFALVDNEDAPAVSERTWCCSDSRYGYAVSRKDGKNTYLHEFLLGKKEGMVIDHRNRNRWDNRRENLRWVTSRGNGANRASKGNSKTGYRGVALPDRGSGFGVRVAGRYIGKFKTAEEAARAYDAEARRVFGEAAVLNFPEGS